jgi:nicotinic acid mononucleotide adenylyltransferase
LLSAAWSARQPLSPATLAKANAGDVLFCPMPEHPASATAIRQALRAGERYPAHLPTAVADYIYEQGLYGR